MRLRLRRGRVTAAGPAPPGAMQRLEVAVAGEARPALADVGMVGAAEPGDDVVVNVQAADLGLGSGGFDLVHVNLTRGLGAPGLPGAHVMKLNYTSLQHAMVPVEPAGEVLERPPPGPVGVLLLHGQLAPVAWALGQAAPGTRVGYVQTVGGALTGGLSDTVRELRGRGLLGAHVTAGPAYGGEQEAITVPGALQHGLACDGWDVALCGPGPGILGSGSALGHGGLAALDSAHAALALGCPTLLAPRMSETDPRPRHRGLSHHVVAVLELLLAPVEVALPDGVPEAPVPPAGSPSVATVPAPGSSSTPTSPAPAKRPGDPAGARKDPDFGRHRARRAPADLAGYRASGLPARTMGRDLDEDPAFFAAALAAGAALADMITR